MKIFENRYRFRARIIPEFLAVLPFLIIITTFLKNFLILGFLSFAIFSIFFQGHFSSKLGRKLEKKLKNNGKLFSNADYMVKQYEENKDKNKYIKLLNIAGEKANLGSPFTTDDKTQQTEKIEQILGWLIENTRDIEKFPALFDKLCDYGFYKNMMAMRVWALIAFVLSLCLLLVPEISFDILLNPNITALPAGFFGNAVEVNTVWVVFIVIWFLLWAKVFSLKALNEARKNYLKTLLRTASSVEETKKTTSSEVLV